MIAHRMDRADRFMSRSWGIDFPLPPRPDTLPPIDGDRLARLAAELFETTTAEPDLDHLDLDLPSVADAMADLRRRVTMDAEAGFSDLVAHTERPVEVIAYFLALLELARWGVVEATQSGWLSEIRVKAAVVDLTIESEWE